MASGSKSKSIPKIIVSLDFGTTYSGYGLAFPGEYFGPQRELTIYTNPREEKVPTCVLLNANKTFRSFGSKAYDEYIDMENAEREAVYFFRNFKMALYENRKLSRNIEIQDEKGKKLPAKLVFQLSMAGLKDIVMARIMEHHKIGSLENVSNAIKWMITIPAIWTDSARQFMREAAEGAGIQKDQLRLVLEPEAASLFCRQQKIILTDFGTRQQFVEGQKYVIADLGGGTIDICVHEIIENGHLKELYRATGEGTGGTKVDAAFEKFLASLFGQGVVNELRATCYERYAMQMRGFEEKKKTFDGTERNVKLMLDPIMMKSFEDKSGKSVQHAIEESQYCANIKYDEKNGRMTFETSVIKGFYNVSVDCILAKMQTIIEECADDGLKLILVVGGYAESRYLRQKMKEAFSTLQLVLVEDAKLAVIKGSVMMGLEEKNIVERKSRFTYGFRVAKSFIEGIHPVSLKFTRDGHDMCKIFKKIITKGQTLTYNETFKYTTSDKLEQTESKKLILSHSLYRSTEENPKYCTKEEGCELVGKVLLNPPSEGWADFQEFELHLIVGETEFTVKTYNKYSGEELQATLDFL